MSHNCYERALIFLHKACDFHAVFADILQMPRVWTDYLDLLVYSGKITLTRRTFDEALRALAITQHHRIWPLYLEVTQKYG